MKWRRYNHEIYQLKRNNNGGKGETPFLSKMYISDWIVLTDNYLLVNFGRNFAGS